MITSESSRELSEDDGVSMCQLAFRDSINHGEPEYCAAAEVGVFSKIMLLSAWQACAAVCREVRS